MRLSVRKQDEDSSLSVLSSTNVGAQQRFGRWWDGRYCENTPRTHRYCSDDDDVTCPPPPDPSCDQFTTRTVHGRVLHPQRHGRAAKITIKRCSQALKEIGRPRTPGSIAYHPCTPVVGVKYSLCLLPTPASQSSVNALLLHCLTVDILT